MMEEELASVKKMLLSVVVSNPAKMTFNTLRRDYLELLGSELPGRKFGYQDSLQFIRERCTDIFLIEGPTWNPVLTPKITKNLAHIDKMVQRQRVQSSTKHIGKRRSVYQHSQPVESRPITKSNPPNRYNTPTTYKKKPAVLQNTEIVTKTEGSKPKINQDNKPKLTQDIENGFNNQQTYNKNYESNDNECNTYHINNEKENIHSNLTEECCPSSALSEFYKKRLPQYNSDMEFPSPDAENNSKGSAESGRQSSTSSTSKQALLDDVKNNIAALIRGAECGVWCTDLLKLYKERFGHELRFQRFGHSSVLSLVCSMGERVCISRPHPDGDRLLQDPQRGRAPPPAVRAPRRAPPPRARSPGADDALPGVEFEPDVFPEDCVHFLESIPAPPLEGLAAGAQLEVMVGELYSPSHLWLLRVGPRHNLAMEELMDRMAEYYRGEGAARALACGAVRVGHYCAALYENDWHRALIVCVVDSDTVKVRHVDYGTVDTVSVAALKPLRREWSRLPAQGIRARLAGCRPSAAGWRWPRAACAWLLARVQDRRLYANVLHVDCTEEIMETFLIDTSGAEDLCLTRELIRVGHADQCAESALQREDCYLYPRFEVLERGASPNYADICRMLADGIRLEYVHAYRQHVPGPWTRRPETPAPPTPPAPLDLSPPSPPTYSVPPRPLDATYSAPHSPPHSPPPTYSVPPRPPHPAYSAHESPRLPSPHTYSFPPRPTRPTYSPHESSRLPSPPTYSVPPRPIHPTYSAHQSPPHSPLPTYSVPPRPPHLTCSPHESPRLPSPLTYSVPPRPPRPTYSPHESSRLPFPPTYSVPPRPLHATYSAHQSPPHSPPPSYAVTPRPPHPTCSPHESPRLPSPATYSRNAPGGDPGAETLEVCVSSAEWAVLAHLRAADADAARWYALTVAWRALLPPPPGL